MGEEGKTSRSSSFNVFEFEEDEKAEQRDCFVFVYIDCKVGILSLFVISLIRHGITIPVDTSLLAPPRSVLPHHSGNPVFE